jgi:hypothetical protein
LGVDTSLKARRQVEGYQARRSPRDTNAYATGKARDQSKYDQGQKHNKGQKQEKNAPFPAHAIFSLSSIFTVLQLVASDKWGTGPFPPTPAPFLCTESASELDLGDLFEVDLWL